MKTRKFARIAAAEREGSLLNFFKKCEILTTIFLEKVVS